MNSYPHHIHGGSDGFHNVYWNIQPFSSASESGVVLTHTSFDGTAGYPGTLQVEVLYNQPRWTIGVEYFAKSDEKTVFNPTQHSYFNLSGQPDSSVKDHRLTLFADCVTVTNDSIPTGKTKTVKHSAFDFTSAKLLATSLSGDIPAFADTMGLDHFWLSQPQRGVLTPFAGYHKKWALTINPDN